MSKFSSPSNGPANIGMSTVHRTPNGGLLAEERQDYRSTLEEIKSDPVAVQFMEQHPEVWLQHQRRR